MQRLVQPLVRRLGIPLALVGATSCGLSDQAKRVRAFENPTEVEGCESLGVSHGHAGGWLDKDKWGAYDDIKEETVDMGGDSFLVKKHTSGFSGHDIYAEVYRCKGVQNAVAVATAPAAPNAPKPAPPAAPLERVNLKKPAKIVVLGFRALEVEPHVVEIFTSLMTSELQSVGNLTVIERADIEAALDLEKTKDLMDCDTSSCLAEIAGAMGTSLVLYGTVGSLGGESYAISASIFDNRLGSALARISKIVDPSAKKLAEAAPGITVELAKKMNQ